MRAVFKVAVVLLCVFLIWNIYIYVANKPTTELAVKGSIRDSVSAEGYLIKNETLITSPADGVLQPYVSDCEKAGNAMPLAAILSGETDEAARKQLTVLKSRIASLEDAMTRSSFGDDVLVVDSSIDENVKKIIKYSMHGKMTNISEYKNDIVKLVDRRNAIQTGSGQAILSILTEEKKTLESRLGNLINEIYAPCSGVFSARLDGLEEVLTPQSIQELTVSSLEQYKNSGTSVQNKVLKGENVCKIIDNFNWYLAVLMNGAEAQELGEKSYVRIDFRNAGGQTALAAVYHVSNEENGKAVIVFRLNRDLEGILSRRHVSIDIIKNTYEGLKAPVKALRVEDGVTGVYVENGSAKKFKPVNVLYKNNDYMILEEDNSKENALLLYDKVLIGGE